ncbi:MAG: glycoside hydrolase family 43 protein [Actinobacteria bacterium HGW-Actinobacteria-4]|nr:MAG: glycoside hydrolase family 43 protein [Actinobacteria bacterium HGW-Actinobacteria-4]
MVSPETVAASHHPILPGFYPDPSICEAHGTYYVALSSFEYAPGVPLWRSEDLLSWEPVAHALPTDAHFPAGTSEPSRGVYAPTLRYHDGRFWMITTNVHGSDGGHILVTAERIEGPWSEPVVVALEGIDPDIAWDDQNRCLVTYCSTTSDPPRIVQAEIDSATGAVLDEPRELWSGTGLLHPEAPHVIRRGQWWYLLIAEGGTERGHTVAIARGTSPRGPFVGAPHNPILSHRSLSHQVQNTGHADMIETPSGDWAMVYLGVRPRGFSPGFHVNGRETFLAGVTWREDWPHVDTEAFSIPEPQTFFSDSFDTWPLHPRWVSPGLRPEDFVAPAPGGGALVSPAGSPIGRPSLLAARARDAWWESRVTVRPGLGTAVLTVRLDDRHWCEVRADSTTVAAVTRIGDVESTLGTMAHSGGSVVLVARAVEPTTLGPDDVVVGFDADGAFTELGRIDGRYLSTEVAAGFTGRVIGVRAIDADVTVTTFGYGPTSIR